MLEVMLSEFNLSPEIVLFDYSVGQVDMLIECRAERNKSAEEGTKEVKTTGTFKDLKSMFGG